MENEKQFIERLLNQGLARRGQNQPAPGFETRILSRLRQDSASPLVWTRSWQFGLSLAAAAAFAVSAAIILRNPAKNRQAVAPTFRSAIARRAGAKAGAVASAIPQSRTSPGTTGGANPKSEIQNPKSNPPHLSVFPSPAPLTEQEKILISLVKHNDRQALDALAEILPPPGPPAPLVIQPIEIKPLPPLAPVAIEAEAPMQASRPGAQTSGFEVRGSSSGSQKTD